MFTMTSKKPSDTSLWFYNNLGPSNDLWTLDSAISLLQPNVLNKIVECFEDFESQQKLSLLLSFLRIPRRCLVQWSSRFEAILEVASKDSDPWVNMVAYIVRTFPSTGLFSLHNGGLLSVITSCFGQNYISEINLLFEF